jgi:hypothetical protein
LSTEVESSTFVNPVIEEIQSAPEEVSSPSGEASNLDFPSSSSSEVLFAKAESSTFVNPVIEEIQSAPEEVSSPLGEASNLDFPPRRLSEVLCAKVERSTIINPVTEEIQSAPEEESLPLKTLAKGSQAYREQKTAKKREKYRQREERHKEIKKESQLQAAIEDSKTVSVLIKRISPDDSGIPSWQYVKHSNQKLSELPPKAQIRHFHAWVEKLTGVPRSLQKFPRFDDSEAVTFRRCTDLESPDFEKILGKTFRFLLPMKKKSRIQHWRVRDRQPATIPLHDNFSRPVQRHDISKFGLYFQKTQEAPKRRLRPFVVGLCAPRVHRFEKPSYKESKTHAMQSEFLASAQIIKKPDHPSEDWHSLIHCSPSQIRNQPNLKFKLIY